MKPITRKEFYLAKAAGTYTGPTPPPVLREDYYLATLSGDYSGNCPAPVTRIEKYMSAAAGITSYVPQPVTRIEKYWYAIANGMGYVPEPVTREEHFLYEIITAGPKYIDKIAEGSLILLTDSAEAPLTALTVYGHSTQDGTPSPDNPVPIVSAGSVMTTGAQLFDIEEANNFNTQGGYTVSIDGQKIHVVGNNVEYSAVRLFSYRLTLPAGTYTMSIDHPVPCRIRFDSFISIPANQLSRTATFEESVDITHLAIDTEIGASFDFEFTLMLNSGSTALPWEPYTGGVPGVNPYEGEINVTVSDGGTQSQTLTLSTPGGLPGIPVTSGGNYTDESGRQWICDEIDLKRGKYVQRVEKVESDGTEYWTKLSSVDNGYQLDLSLSDLPTGVNGCGMCNYLTYSNSTSDNTFLVSSSGNLIRFYGEYSTLDEWKAFIAQCQSDGIPLTVYYALATPIETDLTAEEIDAYKALYTYSPNTTVSNDVEAWMKVGYKATP